MTGQHHQQPYGASPETETVKNLVRVAGIFGIIVMVIGIIVMAILFVIIPLLALIGLLPVILGYVFYVNCKKINQLVDQGLYQQAKSKTLIWMIIGFVGLNMIPGIILLIAYMKFDDLMRPQGIGWMPSPPGYSQPGTRMCTGCGQQILANFNNCPHCGKKAV